MSREHSESGAKVTDSEFYDLKDWIVDRWPQATRLTAGQWAAYLIDLRDIDVTDVWAAAMEFYATGSEYPPLVGKLVELARGQASQRHRTVRPALGESTVDGVERYRSLGGQEVWSNGEWVVVEVSGRSPVEVFRDKPLTTA
uniref:Uncharacterized protein n=1 Tax=viral metagenome TaxID=1070528 RepID=A0A6M3Y1G9_9ZZZZ